MYTGLLVSYNTRYSCQLLTKLDFLYRFSNKYQISNLMKIGPVKVELFREEGQT